MPKTDNRSRTRRNGLVAMVAGVALLFAGSTYALRSATAPSDGGTISAGDLNLTVEDGDNYDVSADRSDIGVVAVTNGSDDLTFATGQVDAYNAGNGDAATLGIKAVEDVLYGHEVDLETWLIVPGDTAAVTKTYTITLKGDNLVAGLTLDASALTGGKVNTDLAYSYAIFGANGKQIGAISNINALASAQQIALFQANNDGQDAGVDDQYLDPISGAKVAVPVVAVDGTETVTVVVFAHFADTGSTQGRDNVNASDALGNISMTLTQVRDITDAFTDGTPTSFPTVP